MLPQQYRKRRVLEELIGDLTEHEARGKVNNLLPENILQLATDETLELHPLYAQLFSDPTIKYCDNTGAEHEGPIAELSIDFRFHLLNNLFVSSNITHNNTLCIYRKLGEELGLSDPKNNIDCSSSNNGWYGVFALYGINAKDPLLFRIHSAIESNHADLEDNLAVSVDELENIFCDHKYDDYDPTNLLSEDEILEIASAYGIDLGAVNGAELDIDEDLVPLSEDEVTHNLTEKDFSPWWHPKQPSFFVIVTGETGASIWIVNYVTKQEYCVLNLHSQRCADARYFNANKSTVPCTINTMLSGSIVEFLGGCIPQYLYVPGCIANGIPIQFVSACGSRDLFDDNCEIICFPPEIKSVCDIEHFSPPKRMVFLGEGVSIKDAPFCMSGEHIEGVILPDEVERLGDLLFSVWNTLDHLVIPSGTITDIRYPGKELYERSILIEGKCFLPIQMVNGTTVHYDTDNILDALCSESMEMPTIYDRTNRYCLDWEKIHSLFADKPIFSLSLKIGVEIFLDDQGNIRYSQEVVHKYPWIIYCRDAYISSVPRECKIYTRAKCTDRELREADQVYTEDIISILQYCVNEATECISGGNKTDAQTLLQIAKDLLDAKSSILPQDVDDIRKKISELLIRVQ